MSHKFNQKGFAVVEGMLVLVILGLVGFTGYYVWHSEQQANKVYSQTAKIANSSAAKSTKSGNQAAGWKTYVSKAGKFTVKYPSTWVQPTNQSACGEFLARDLELGPDKGSVITCGSDGSVSQVSISSEDGDHRQAAVAENKTTNYKDTSAIQGALLHGALISGFSGTAIHQQDNEGLGGLPDGTLVDVYVYYKNNVTFTVRYTQLPAQSKEGPTQNQEATFGAIMGSLRMEPYADNRTEGP